VVGGLVGAVAATLITTRSDRVARKADREEDRADHDKINREQSNHHHGSVGVADVARHVSSTTTRTRSDRIRAARPDIAFMPPYGESMEARRASGCTDLPGYGVVHWTAEEMLVPDGSVFATVLETAILGNGEPLSEDGRNELIFWESMSA
jgi:hypothetical protein